ncbi:MAG: DUF58 domain-containing protein [Phycisphaerales bacterium]|nr:DUF58 domain-containing protein [Phycisphaerales bacterium]
MASQINEANLLLLLATIGSGMVLVSIVLVARSVNRVSVERLVPDAVMAGRSFTITYIVRNPRRWSRGWGLIIGEYPSGQDASGLGHGFIGVLAPGEERRIEVEQVVPRRGRIRLHAVRVQSRFSLGLFSCTVDHVTPAELMVYPVIARFRRDPWRERSRTMAGGGSAPRQVAIQDEFFGLREYRQGDNYRWIHWRRSARMGELLVREMRAMQLREMVVIVDPWSAPYARMETDGAGMVDVAAERVISAATAAVCDGLDRGYRVGLICRAAEPVLIPVASGRVHRQRVLRELALLQPESAESLADLVARSYGAKLGQARLVVCTARMSPQHEGLVRYLHRQAEALLVLCPEQAEFQALVDLGRETRDDRRAS